MKPPQLKRLGCLITRKTTKANSCTRSASNSQDLEHEQPNTTTKLKKTKKFHKQQRRSPASKRSPKRRIEADEEKYIDLRKRKLDLEQDLEIQLKSETVEYIIKRKNEIEKRERAEAYVRTTLY